MKNNPVVFWELASHDMEKSTQFFRKVFNWQIDFNEKLGFYSVLEIGDAQRRQLMAEYSRLSGQNCLF